MEEDREYILYAKCCRKCGLSMIYNSFHNKRSQMCFQLYVMRLNGTSAVTTICDMAIFVTPLPE